MWKIIRWAFTVFSIGFSRSWFVTMKRLAHFRVSWWQPDLDTVSGATLLACLIEINDMERSLNQLQKKTDCIQN